MGHPFVSPNDCEWVGIIIRVIYIFTKEQIECPFIPNTLDVADIKQLRDWLSIDPGDFIGYPSHNGLKLFLWIVDDYYHLLDRSE
jgi:hypothetical protein